ncbi:MAG TPA: efflux RND transporter periplasmic adaptor subunit [Bacteroidetes bacterium]|nr:efflux RND transporter periplasmic adaptor subunit [Bacteroidota bacterium]
MWGKGYITILPVCVILVLTASCRNRQEQSLSPLPPAADSARIIGVETERLSPEPFSLEIVSNGKIQSARKAVIPFRVEGIITGVFAENGRRVTAGQLLATLETEKFRLALEKARNELERTALEMENLLLGFGYTLSDSARVPPAQWNTVRVQSGYNQALTAFREAEYNLSHTRITAPFEGVVADLWAEPYNHTSAYDFFCTLIDVRNMEVVFPVLESEAGGIGPGMPVRIVPYAGGREIRGRITTINPRVDEYGLVTVTARLENAGDILMEGMNVQVTVEEVLPACLSVPRNAVVLRQGRQVVFTFHNGLALWNYVETGPENSRRIVITAGLEEGMEVIVSGNLNLAHETPVVRRNLSDK